jgi:hypothetical protein
MFFVQVIYFNVNSKAVILMVAVTDWGIKLLFWSPVLIGG